MEVDGMEEEEMRRRLMIEMEPAGETAKISSKWNVMMLT